MGTESGRPPDQVALARIVAGDATAVDDIMDRHRALVTGAARRVLGNSADVEDVKQETWMSLWTKGASIRRAESLGAWLWTTSTNHALRLARRRGRDVVTDPVALSGERVGPDDDAAAALLVEEVRAVVHAAVGSLAPVERALIELLFQSTDRSYAEVAQLAGRPVGSLGPTRRRILDKLKHHTAIAALAPDGAGAEGWHDGEPLVDLARGGGRGRRRAAA
jgi:RNA polymerase sigma factor (sigma-70 family)